jgi:hypothetical protein
VWGFHPHTPDFTQAGTAIDLNLSTGGVPAN